MKPSWRRLRRTRRAWLGQEETNPSPSTCDRRIISPLPIRERGQATSGIAMSEVPANIMGKPTGFIEFKRELPADRSAVDRVKDWAEFHLHMDESRLKQQGARCMDCGV